MANSDYKAAVFPFTVGGGPGGRTTLVLTPTLTNTPSTPVTAVADRAAYFAADATAKNKHDRFTALVLYFQQYGTVVSASSSGTAVTIEFEATDLWAPNTTLGIPTSVTKIQRKNAYNLGVEFCTNLGSTFGADTITAIAVTIDGVSQTS